MVGACATDRVLELPGMLGNGRNDAVRKAGTYREVAQVRTNTNVAYAKVARKVQEPSIASASLNS